MYDEDVPPANARGARFESKVYHETNRAMITRRFIFHGFANQPIDIEMPAGQMYPMPVKMSGMSPLHSAVINADLPLAKALIRTGEDPDTCSDNPMGPALHLAVSQRTHCYQRDTERATVLLDIVKLLLDVGADPTSRSKVSDLLNKTLLEMAISAGDLDTVSALLNCPLSDRIVRTQRNLQRVAEACAPTPDARHRTEALIKAAQSRSPSQQPPLLCPCSSGRPVAICHGHKDGGPCHPRQPCPCKRNQERILQGRSAKTYGECCLARGEVLRENLTGHIIRTTIMSGESPVLQALQIYAKHLVPELRALGYSNKEIGRKLSQKMKDVASAAGRKQLYDSFVPALVQSKHIDRAFSFAAYEVDFMPSVWRTPEGAMLPQEEAVRRQSEWNSRVDEYIASAAATGDGRSRRAIARAAKVDSHGASLYATCPAMGCSKEEDKPASFKVCSRCRAVRYCSAECQKAHWKAEHKQQCGTDDAYLRLPSEVVFSETLSQMVECVAAFVATL